MTFACEFDCLALQTDGLLQIRQFAQSRKARFITVSEVVEVHRFVGVTFACEFDCLALQTDGLLQIRQFAQSRKARFITDSEVVEVPGLLG